MEMPGRGFSVGGYRFGFNGMEQDDEVKGSGNSLDFGARVYDSRLGRFLSIDPLSSSFPLFSPYIFAENIPTKLIDVNGEYGGEKTRSISSFIKNLKFWEVEAGKNTITYTSSFSHIREPYNVTLLRVFNHDITSKSKGQIVKEVPGVSGSFSYYENLGADRSGAFVNVGGFPLDLKHFMANVELGNTIKLEFLGRALGINEEKWQDLNPLANERARTSAFSPEDLMSNALGLIFSRYDDNGDFSGDLEKMLKEAEVLFSTNELKDGKFITNSDVETLREMMDTYQGTDDFRDLRKGSRLYNQGNMEANRTRNRNNTTAVGRFFTRLIHGNVTTE